MPRPVPPPPDGLKPYLAILAKGGTLEVDDAQEAFDLVLRGEATEAQIGALLIGLRARGETAEEIMGAAMALRRNMTWIKAPETAIDIMGTGGDAAGIYNVSTAAALVVAGCGVPVAKQGGRSVSSRSGSSDVIEALGVNLSADFPVLERAIKEAGLVFLSAPRHHPTMKQSAALRGQLGTKTIFNLLGPLTNPAGVRRHLIGVADRKWLMPFAEVLRDMGSDSAWIVHGSDGLDEITTTGATHIVELRDGKISAFDITPADAGLFTSKPEELKGGEPSFNATALKAVLGGAQNAYRNIVLLNSAAALVVSGAAVDLRMGAELARSSLDGGKARAALDRLINVTNAP